MTLDQVVKFPTAPAADVEHSEWNFGGPGSLSFVIGGGHSSTEPGV